MHDRYMINKTILRFGVLMLILVLSSCKKDSYDERFTICLEENVDELRMNELQIIASHNSYRLRTYQPIFDLFQLVTSIVNYDVNGWDYNHIPISEQLEEFHIRGLELDIYYDPQGGLFYKRAGNGLVGESVFSGIPALQEPGMKMLHIPDIDYRTNYITFKDGLYDILNWSNDHPDHFPIYVMIELKEGGIPLPGFAQTLSFDDQARSEVVTEILDVFPMDKLITPDGIRGPYAFLDEALAAEGWPTIAGARGKVLFFFNNKNEQDGVIFGSNQSLTVNGDMVIKMFDNPQSNLLGIQQVVEMGFLVRTRADADTDEARSGLTARRERAFESGAQIISTDYYQPDERYKTDPEHWTNFNVQWPERATAKRNSVRKDCYAIDF